MSIVILPRRKERRRTLLVGRQFAPSPIVLPGDPGTGAQPPSSGPPASGGPPGPGFTPPGLRGTLPPGLGGPNPGQGRGRGRDQTGAGGGGGGGGGEPTQLILANPAPGSMMRNTLTNQVGWSFTLSKAATVTGARVLINANRTMTVRLWRASDEALLASVDVAVTTGTWGSEDFASPVALASGVTYVAGIRSNEGFSTSVFFVDKGSGSLTLESFVTHIGGVSSAGDGYPGIGTGDNLVGLVDLLVTA